MKLFRNYIFLFFFFLSLFLSVFFKNVFFLLPFLFLTLFFAFYSPILKMNAVVTLMTTCCFFLAGKWELASFFLIFISILFFIESFVYCVQKKKLAEKFPADKCQVVLYNSTTKNKHFISLDDVKRGDIIVVQPNEKILVDGIIVQGSGEVEEGAFYGKSRVSHLKEKDLVFAGFTNLNGTIYVQVQDSYFSFFIVKLKKLIQEDISEFLSLKRLNCQLFAYSLFCLFICCLFLMCYSFHKFYFIGVVLWILCFQPFAFLHAYLPVRMSYQLQKIGVFLLKKVSLFQLFHLKNIIFTKTGVLTLSDFSVTNVVSEKEEDFWYFLHCALYKTDSLIANCIRKYHDVEVDTKKIKKYQSYENGYSFTYNRKIVFVGNYKFLKDMGITVERVLDIGTVLYVVVQGETLGYLVISDKMNGALKESIQLIREFGIYNLVTFSKDDNRLVSAVSRTVGIQDSYSDLDSETFDFWLHYYQQMHGSSSLFISDNVESSSVQTNLLMNAFSGNSFVNSDIIVMDRDMDKVVTLLMYCQVIRKEFSKIRWCIIWSKVLLLFSFLFITRNFYYIFILYVFLMIPTIIRVLKVSLWKRGANDVTNN